jgi:hypothetical protein
MHTRFRLRSDRAPTTDWPFLRLEPGDFVNSIADGVSILLRRLVARFSAAAGACRHIRVSPMSERWLQSQAVEYAKHDDAV